MLNHFVLRDEPEDEFAYKERCSGDRGGRSSDCDGGSSNGSTGISSSDVCGSVGNRISGCGSSDDGSGIIGIVVVVVVVVVMVMALVL